MDNKALERRITALELKIEAMEARRARIVPKEIEDDPNIISLMTDRLKNQVDTWKSVLARDGISEKEARMREMQAQALRELEAQGRSERQRLEAEIVAVIQYYEKHGMLPDGCDYVIEDDGLEAINTKIF